MVIRNFEAVLAVTPWLCALIAVLFAVRRMCDGRVRARTFRVIWFVVAVRAALPVQFTLPQTPASFELPEWGDKPVTVFRTASGAAGEVLPVTETAAPVSLHAVLAFVWAAVAAGLALVYAVRWLMFVIRLYRTRSPMPGYAKVYTSPKADVPFAFGLLHPAVYLPETAEPDDVPYILEHEMRHIRAGDLWLQAVLLAAQCVQWFNPLVHIMARMARRDMELACDEAVLEHRAMAYRIRYAQTVLNAMRTARRKTLLAAPLCGRRANKVRWREMFNLSRKKKAGALVAAACTTVLLASLLMGCNTASGTERSVSESGSVSPYSAPLELGAQEETEESPQSAQAEQITVSEETNGEAADEVYWPVPDYTYLATRFMQGGHRGIDICAPSGTAIFAVQGGTVTFSGYNDSFGNHVEIDCGDGLAMLYAHCSELYVTEGQSVATGDLIAAVGATGMASGNQCHLEMTRDGILFDPGAILTLPD